MQEQNKGREGKRLSSNTGFCTSTELEEYTVKIWIYDTKYDRDSKDRMITPGNGNKQASCKRKK